MNATSSAIKAVSGRSINGRTGKTGKPNTTTTTTKDASTETSEADTTKSSGEKVSTQISGADLVKATVDKAFKNTVPGSQNPSKETPTTPTLTNHTWLGLGSANPKVSGAIKEAYAGGAFSTPKLTAADFQSGAGSSQSPGAGLNNNPPPNSIGPGAYGGNSGIYGGSLGGHGGGSSYPNQGTGTSIPAVPHNSGQNALGNLLTDVGRAASKFNFVGDTITGTFNKNVSNGDLARIGQEAEKAGFDFHVDQEKQTFVMHGPGHKHEEDQNLNKPELVAQADNQKQQQEQQQQAKEAARREAESQQNSASHPSSVA